MSEGCATARPSVWIMDEFAWSVITLHVDPEKTLSEDARKRIVQCAATSEFDQWTPRDDCTLVRECHVPVRFSAIVKLFCQRVYEFAKAISGVVSGDQTYVLEFSEGLINDDVSSARCGFTARITVPRTTK